MKLQVLSLGFALLLATTARAGYLAIGESGEMLPENEYQFGVAPQILLNEGGGGNVDVFMDAPYSDSTSFRIQAGAGKIDFHAGAGVKFVPFPDVDRQPALGGKASVWFGRVGDNNALTLQLAPMVSKKFVDADNTYAPYAAIAANITSAKDRNFTGTQFVFGSDARLASWREALLTAEIALNLKDSYSAFTFCMAFPFDGSRGFRQR